MSFVIGLLQPVLPERKTNAKYGLTPVDLVLIALQFYASVSISFSVLSLCLLFTHHILYVPTKNFHFGKTSFFTKWNIYCAKGTTWIYNDLVHMIWQIIALCKHIKKASSLFLAVVCTLAVACNIQMNRKLLHILITHTHKFEFCSEIMIYYTVNCLLSCIEVQ